MLRTTAVALLAASALSPLALAQTTRDNRAGLDRPQSCAALIAYVERGLPKPENITAEDARLVADAGDARICDDALRLARGEISTVESAPEYDAVVAERVLAVIDPDPKVTVRAPDPVVTVQRKQPSVTVDPGQPIVTVRQAAPVVKVATAAPRITVEIPKPEILVEMPDPSVRIASARPRVTIDQGPPEVTVERGEVEVKVGGGETAPVRTGVDDGSAEEARLGESRVEIRDGGEPAVSVSQAKPEVRYEIAEPKIEMGPVEEPEISFVHTGEAVVKFRQMTAEETREISTVGAGDAAERLEQAAKDEATQAQRYTVVRSSAEVESEAAETATVSVDEMVGLPVYGADGEKVGEVENVVISQGEIYAIVGAGGFFGIGEKEVALAVGDMAATEAGLVLRRIEESDLESMREVDAGAFQSVDAQTRIEIIAR